MTTPDLNKLAEVKRYYYDLIAHEFKQHPLGQWVQFDDAIIDCTVFLALLQEVETLREQLSSALKVIENLHRQPTVEDGETKP